jgi:hypothetical protein
MNITGIMIDKSLPMFFMKVTVNPINCFTYIHLVFKFLQHLTKNTSYRLNCISHSLLHVICIVFTQRHVLCSPIGKSSRVRFRNEDGQSSDHHLFQSSPENCASRLSHTISGHGGTLSVTILRRQNSIIST